MAKAIVIFEDTTKAIDTAKKFGAFNIIDHDDIKNERFSLYLLAADRQDCIIVDNCPVDTLIGHRTLQLIRNHRIHVSRQVLDLEIIDNIQWIFVINLRRRFIIL